MWRFCLSSSDPMDADDSGGIDGHCHFPVFTEQERIMKKPHIPKINSIHFGGLWIAVGVGVGGVLPLLIWLTSRRFVWPLCALGGVILAAFAVVLAVEMHQDFGKTPYFERHLAEAIPFDPETHYAVIRASICTGERVAGFKSRADGHFTEVMVLRNDMDEQKFLNAYHLDSVKKEY